MGNAAVKGAGVSCQTLAANIYMESGFLPADFEIVKAPMEWSHAQTESLIVKSLNALPEYFTPIAHVPFANALRPGDFLGFKIGGCVHHCAIVVDASGRIIHCLRGHGTVYSTIYDASYLTRLENAWRPMLNADTQR
jgi:cell wall-associated NlpC family hydrolase